MERNHTFKSIADLVDRDKRTVQNWWAKHESETSTKLGKIDETDSTRKFTDQERDILISYGKPAREKVEFVQSEPVKAAEIIEFEGTRFNTSLAANHFDGAVGRLIQNPDEAVGMVELLCSSVLSALEEKVDVQKQGVAKTQQAQWKVEGQVEAFTEAATKLGIKSKTLAAAQTKTTEELQAKLAEMIQLGTAE